MADLQAGGSALTSQDRADIRTGLGLGDSATRNIGTTAGTVAEGDDPRFSDDRDPTAHMHAASDISDSTTVGRAVLTAADAAAARTAIGAAASGAGISAPSTLDGTSASANGATLHLAAGGTLTIAAGALAVLPGGVTIIVGQSGSATLAFGGGALKENAAGTSATSVTLAASGVYALLPSPSGSDKWRLTGGASL